MSNLSHLLKYLDRCIHSSDIHNQALRSGTIKADSWQALRSLPVGAAATVLRGKIVALALEQECNTPKVEAVIAQFLDGIEQQSRITQRIRSEEELDAMITFVANVRSYLED